MKSCVGVSFAAEQLTEDCSDKKLTKKVNNMEELIKTLRSYAEEYRKPPYGKKIEGTSELLEKAASKLQEAVESVEKMKKRYIDGTKVNYQGDDADDGIECPFCGYEVARNDDYSDMKPKHCPECGTKLIY